MLNQIVTNTPVFVWAILVFLIVRGFIALRTREISVNKLFIMPMVMLALSLFDIKSKFGLGGTGLATWLVAAAATTALLAKFGAARVAPSTTAGHIIVRGSVWPLVLMMGIFLTKYVTSVAVAINGQLRHDAVFTVVVCAMFGVFSGYFAGRLVRDLKACREFSDQSTVTAQVI
ncbi:MAG: hypothetical protein M3Y65_16065 [Pseudomonadota bacterium]|nr:hypothetical protein [Pseudomonadota bacterium]